MSEFQIDIDIANRACQHCGVPRMDRTLGFADNLKQAAETGFVYGKLRRAELMQNNWTFAIKKAALRPIDTNTMILAPALWSSLTTYFVGSIVIDGQDTYWISRIPNNLGNQPQSTPAWEPYFGPLTVALYATAETYLPGELVYTAAGDGTNRVYMSLQADNSDNPATATAWSATATYSKNQTVTYLSVAYQSLIDLNIGNIPSAAPALWASATSYSIGNKVGGSDGIIYTSLTNLNVAHDPTADFGVHWSAGALNPWTTVFVGGAGSLKWLQIGGAEFPSGVTLITPNIIYPLGAGPSSQSNSRNAYRLPAGYLRLAPQDPKAGSQSMLGAPTNALADDWEFDGDYITTAQSGVIVLRFVADFTDVARMHDMFCETLGYRIALAVVEPVTQSTGKKGAIAQEYKKFGSDARLQDAIEAGPIEQPLDDFISCRA